MLTKLFGSLAIASGLFIAGASGTSAAPTLSGCSEGGGCCSESCCKDCPDCDCDGDCCENCEAGCDCSNKA